MELNEVYKCNVCGNIVELVHVGEGKLVCCGQPMELLTEKTEEAGLEEKQGEEIARQGPHVGRSGARNNRRH